MRKSMKQKVALFLSVAMAVTSVDSSVLVTAADVIETVSEAERQEEVAVEEAEVQQEDVAVEEAEVQQEDVVVEEAEAQQEDVAVEEAEAQQEDVVVEETVQNEETFAEAPAEEESVEEAEEDETLATEETEASDEEAPVYTDDAMLGGEQIIGEELYDLEEETIAVDEEIATMADEDDEIKAVINVKPLLTEYTEGNGEIGLGTSFTLTYSNGSTWDGIIQSSAFADDKDNYIELYLKKAGDNKIYSMGDIIPEGQYAIQFCVNKQVVAVTDFLYTVKSLASVCQKELTIGENEIASGTQMVLGEGFIWYSFTAPETKKYYFDKCVGLVGWKKTEGGIENLSINGHNFAAEEGKTYYLGFSGSLWNAETGEWEDSWITTLSSKVKEIEKIELILNNELNYVPCSEDYVPAGLRYRIIYSDKSAEERVVREFVNEYAENGDYIDISLIKNGTEGEASPSYYIDEGDYLVKFKVGNTTFLETDQIVHVSSDLSAMSLPELTVGENIINAEGGGKLSWYQFTAEEDGEYRLDNTPSFWLYKESGKNSLGDYCAQETINLEKGITYYFGFTGDGEYAGTLTCLADSVDIGFDFEDNPTDVCGAPGDRVVLNATAMVNQGTLLYQWYRYEDGEEYVLIPDATAPQYTATVEEEEVTYLCNVTDMFGEVHSRIIVVRPDCSITIEDDYYEQTVKPEEEVTMYVKASTNAGSLSYQWQIERREDGKYIWENIPDAIDATYTVNVERESYRCIVSNGYPEEEKTVYWFFEIESGLKITEPDDIYIEIGQDVTLTAEATTEYGKLSYQWYKVDSDINAKADEEIEGATSETYTVKNVQKSVRYYCEISNGYESDGCGCFICVNSGLKASAENDKLSVKVGETATLKVNATSNYPVTYQWYKWNKWVIGEFTKLDNATEDTYITPAMTEDEYFTCVVSDGYNEEQIDVGISVDYGFYAYAEKATVWVPKGEDAELKVNAGIYEGGGELTYEWYDAEWNQIEGENSSTCTIMNVTNLQKYRCHVQSDHGGKSVQFWVGPQEECGDYALDFSDAKTLEEAVENIAVIPVIDSKAYFKFVPDRTGIWEIYSKADEDTRAWLYDENREEIAAAYLGEAEDYEGIYDFSLKEKLEQGKVYYIATQYMHTLETGSYPVFVRYIGQAEEETHVWDEGTITQPPTCEAAGVKTYECINCGETKTEEIEATGHDYPEEWTVRKAATCTETGVEYRVCHRCEKEETKEIPATGKHEMETVVDKAATCGEEGIQHEECKVCHTKEEATTIPATGKHKMETIVDKEATCGEEGSQHEECKVCHTKGETTSIPATGQHEMETIVDKEATCGEDGSQHKECKVCHTKGETTSIPATGEHEMETIVDKAATCGKAGSQHKECKVCHTKEEATPIPATGEHEMETIVDKAATCGKAGSQHNECKVCHTKEEATPIPATGKHEMETIVDKEATCGEEGSQHNECKVCHTKGETTSIPATGQHEMETIVDKEATCGEAGSQHNECKVCHTKEESTSIPATGEHEMEMIVDKEATCGKAGSQHKECKVCHTKGETTSIPATGQHEMETIVDKEATCGEDGSQHKECKVCHTKEEATPIPATGEHEMETIVDKAATCGKAGSQHKECKVCHTKEEATPIPATGKHEMETIVDKEATCGEEGSQHKECKVCHTKGETTSIPATGQHEMETIVDKEATCGEDGSQHKECKVCHTKEEATPIPATGEHEMETIVDKAATCGKAGSQHKECKICHTKEAPTVIKATGKHSFSNYVVKKKATALAAGTETRTCKACGKTESRSIAKLTATIKLKAAKVTVKVGDSVELSKYVTGLAAGDSVAGYTSSNVKAAVVSKTGKVTGKAVGTTTVTVKLASKKTAKITVTVQKKEIPTTSIKNLSKTMTIKLKGTAQLKPVISPSNTTDKLTYTSSDKNVVAVSAKGKLTAMKVGKAKITVQSGKKKFVITVTVAAPTPTGMKNVPTAKELAKGKTFVLKPILLPAGAKGKITYKSSNTKIAMVDANGKITAKGKGTAQITITVGKVKKTCKVTVK